MANEGRTPTGGPGEATGPAGLVDAAKVRAYLAEADRHERLCHAVEEGVTTSRSAERVRKAREELEAALSATATTGASVGDGGTSLLPCPFCGSPASKGVRGGMNRCGCENAECTVMPEAVDYVSDEALVAAWNTRVGAPPAATGDDAGDPPAPAPDQARRDGFDRDGLPIPEDRAAPSPAAAPGDAPAPAPSVPAGTLRPRWFWRGARERRDGV